MSLSGDWLKIVKSNRLMCPSIDPIANILCTLAVFHTESKINNYIGDQMPLGMWHRGNRFREEKLEENPMASHNVYDYN